MPLRALLTHAADDPAASVLAREGGGAFVSPSLRAYLIAAVADAAPDEPVIVVAGDDRSARDLAADLRAWLEPRAAPRAAGAPRRPAGGGAGRPAGR